MKDGSIGPKAESLHRLVAEGFPVPVACFIGIDAFCEHAERAGIAELLVGEGEKLADPAAVRDAIVTTPVDPDLARELHAWFVEMGARPLAVRSSATAEDLPGASFAGQHGTYFVRDAQQLVERVRDCWASLFSDHAVHYRERHGIPHEDVAMAVIVQRLVPAVASGVVFTASPMDGSDTVWIESCRGLGEALVSGKVTPDRYCLARPDLEVVEVSLGDQEVRVDADARGDVRERAVAEAESEELSISEDLAREVGRLALRVEQLIGCPADVEWAYDGERVWLLQARPITALGTLEVHEEPAAPEGVEVLVPHEMISAGASARPTASGTPVVIWSNVNTGEILPDVATPMTWSIIHGHANDILGGAFGPLGIRLDAKRLIGLVGGRIYFNASLLRETFSVLPGVKPDVALGGMHDFVDLPPLPPLPKGGRVSAVLRAATSLPVFALRHSPKKAVRFGAHMRAETDSALAAIEAGPDLDEAYRLLLHLDADFHEFNDAVAYMAIAMFGFGVLGGITNRWLGDGTGALANRLVAASGEVASAEAGHSLWRLAALARGRAGVRAPLLTGTGWTDVRERLESAREAGDRDAAEFLSAWDAFMVEHGHHRRGELEFSNPTWSERPDYVLRMVRSYLTEDAAADPLGEYSQRAEEAEAAAVECRTRLGGLKRAVFERALRWGRASARSRENIKSEAVRWLVAIRRALLLVGRRLVERGDIAESDDVFFMTFAELGEVVTGGSCAGGGPETAALRDTVRARRAEHERLKTLSPPPVVVGEWDESSQGWSDLKPKRTFKGISVSAGVARGRARVFASAETDESVLPGEILVAPFTDPGWTPYFVPAAGIVMDMGGLLSHGSIIAREYGIPAVVNVGPATRIISTGQLIEVDGDKGEVRVLG